MPFSSILGFAMAIVYVGLGIFLLVSNNIYFLSDFQKLGMGIILGLYGAFRFYRTIKKTKEIESENDEI